MGSPATLTLREATAAEIRAEMARQRKTGIDCSVVIDRTQQATSRRLNGEVDMSLDEIAKIAGWLGVSIFDLVPSRNSSTAGADETAQESA